MKLLRRFFKRLTGLSKAQHDEERLQAEIEEHLALQTTHNIRAGLSPAEARRQAVLKFGAVQAVKESYREERRLPFVETLMQDARHALRRLRNAPAFTVTTFLTLALGIGATTSIFTLVYAVLLKSLAVANPGELYRLGKEPRCCYWGGYSQDKEFSLVSYDLYRYFRNHTTGFAELAAFSASEDLFGIRRASRPEPAQGYPGEYVSGNYFRMFGVNAFAGRMLTPNDDQLQAAPVAVMSFRLWRDRYGSDPAIVGAAFDLSGKPYTVVGIAPPAFFGDTLRNSPPDFFLPLNTRDPGDLRQPDSHFLELIGRIQPGAQPSRIEAQMRVELEQWLRSHWADMTANERTRLPEQTLFLSPGGAGITSMRHDYEHWLQILMTVTALVLLIACANIASLTLVRSLGQRRQTSLSMALGAWPSRLVRQTLTESTLLALLGGAAGIAVAYTATTSLLHFVFPTDSGMAAIPISASPSWTVLAFALSLSVITGIAFGIAPAWMATRVDPIEALRGPSRSTTRMGSLPRKALVVFQAALSLALLSTSGLLIHALHRLENQNFGFDLNRRIIVNCDPRLAGYQPNRLAPLYKRIHDSLSGIPGMSAVALCIYSPLSGNNMGTGVWVNGHPPPGPKDDNYALWERVSAGYFDVIGNPILRGRGISRYDTSTSHHVAVINEAFARKFFRNEDPIGKVFGRSDMGESRQYEIVGIAKDARYLTFALDGPVAAAYFLPEEQIDLYPKVEWAEGDGSSHYLRDIVLFTQPGAHVSDSQIRHAIASIDSNLPIISIRTLRDQVAAVFRDQRLIARLTSFFALLSLILSCIGLYGVTAYNATQRTSEIGIRTALGANRGQVVALVLRGAFVLIGVGLLIGLPVTLAAGKFLGSQLYGANPYNPLVTSLAVAALGSSALLAALIPALRAGSISPLEALRTE